MSTEKETCNMAQGFGVKTPLTLLTVNDMGDKADEFLVDPLCALESCTISSFFKYELDCGIIDVKSDTLEWVLDFCKRMAKLKHDNKESLQQELKILESEISKKDQHVLIDYLQAAQELQIRSLFDFTCNALLDSIKGKDSNEILKIFNLRCGFTVKDMKEFSNTHYWAFE